MSDRSIYEPVFAHIQREIIGRIAIKLNEALCLAHYANASARWCEIGCLWGGTAILATLAGASDVVTVDPMLTGYWVNGDPSHKMIKPTPGKVLENFKRFGVAHKIHVVKTYSVPWPIPGDYQPDAMFIDGDHSLRGILSDWETVQQLKPRYALFHDNQPDHPGVARAIEGTIRQASGWEFVEQAESITVMKCLTRG